MIVPCALLLTALHGWADASVLTGVRQARVPAVSGMVRVAPVAGPDIFRNPLLLAPGIGAPVVIPGVPGSSPELGLPGPVIGAAATPVPEVPAPGSLPALKSAASSLPADASLDQASAGLSKAFEGARVAPPVDLDPAGGRAPSFPAPLASSELRSPLPFSGVRAYSFRSRLSLANMEERLNAKGAYRWHRAESDSLGDYLVSRPFSDQTRLRIVEQDGAFVLDVMFASDASDADQRWRSLQRELRWKILRAVKARGVQATLSLD